MEFSKLSHPSLQKYVNVGEYLGEQQYLDLIGNILMNGSTKLGRNGNTISKFGDTMRFSLQNGEIPILTTKKVAWKTCLKELLWFISGNTNNKILQSENVHIWDGNSTREFLDSRGLTENKEGDLGPVYGFQWRHFNAEYKGCDENYDSCGIDQLANVISLLKNKETRNSRRIIMSAWNPCQLDQMALPPCHVICQFNITDDDKLSCLLFQRSGDVGLGVPFNIASYSLLTHIIAKHCGLVPFEFVYVLGDAHIYDNHINAMVEQVGREPYAFPTLNITNIHENIEDYTITDFELLEYKHHAPIKMDMSA